jgi:hypothetical protein
MKRRRITAPGFKHIVKPGPDPAAVERDQQRRQSSGSQRHHSPVLDAAHPGHGNRSGLDQDAIDEYENDRRELAQRFANQQKTLDGAIDEVADRLCRHPEDEVCRWCDDIPLVPRSREDL